MISWPLLHDALERLLRGKTTIVIAHHFAAMENFGLILVLKNSGLIEQGTNAELMEREGHYHKLYQRQVRAERFHAQLIT